MWVAFHLGDQPDLREHERDVLHHAADRELTLSELAGHLALPISTASVLVKGLARRGFLQKRRDSEDERRVRIACTAKGRARVRAGSVLELRPLSAALARLPAHRRAMLLRALDELVRASGPA